MERVITRCPTLPGDIIRYDYMEPLKLTVKELAERLGVSRKHFSNILSGQSRITADMALRLSRAFRTTPGLWLNLQREVDLWKARQQEEDWKKVQPLPLLETTTCSL